MMRLDQVNDQFLSPLTLVSVAAFILILTLLSRYLIDPRRHIPGPWASTLSSTPLFIQALRGRKAMWIRSLHNQYGPVIRIAPNKVCVSSEEGIKLIYSNKAAKSHAYDGFRFRDVKMCIGLLDMKDAHTRRKALLPAFSRQNLLEMEPVIRRHLERFLEWLVKFDQKGVAVDTFKWFRYLTFDVITDIAFGQQIGMLSSEDSHFVSQVELRNKRNSLVRTHANHSVLIANLQPGRTVSVPAPDYAIATTRVGEKVDGRRRGDCEGTQSAVAVSSK